MLFSEVGVAVGVEELSVEAVVDKTEETELEDAGHSPQPHFMELYRTSL